MSTLNLSTNGPSISRSYHSVINALVPLGHTAQSATYGQWAVFSVSAPLANAFQQDAAGKESVLKVQCTGEGELVDLIDEFSDGRVQFAFAKIRDPNTTLPKLVLIGWCGEGVPERTKGYFTSHLAAVSKVLHGYHVQVTARSDRDLTPESIIKKISDASGSNYAGGGSSIIAAGPPPPISSKPAFTPTKSSGGQAGFNPLSRSCMRPNAPKRTAVDEDGWGQDAPPVTRTQLEKVQSSYEPTKLNMRELSSQKPDSSRFGGSSNDGIPSEGNEVVKGDYQPVGRVDIAALKRQAEEKTDQRPTAVKGSYEPVGKIDIAAIRARAQQPSAGTASPPSNMSPAVTGTSDRSSGQSGERSASISASERLTFLPKPKVAHRFGAGSSSFTGTKAPTPTGLGLEPKITPAAVPTGVGRTFADEGGKTPAQLWAEKKSRDQGFSGANDNPPLVVRDSAAPIKGQNSAEWKSGYGGKTWAPVQTTQTGQSASSFGQQRTGQHGEKEAAEEAVSPSPTGGVGVMRHLFRGAAPMAVADIGSGVSAPSPPPLDTSSKPNAPRGVPVPSLPARPAQPQEAEQEAPRLPTPPAQPQRSPTPPTPPVMESGSPIRVAIPVARGRSEQNVGDARGEQFSPPPSMPTRSLAQAIPHEDDLTEEPIGYDTARGAGEATAAAAFGQHAAESAHPGAHGSGKRALVQYDYEKAEENELEMREGEYVTNIEMVDDDWWMGHNPRGESGLFPSNYVELVEANDDANEQLSQQAEAKLQLEREHEHGQIHGGGGAETSKTATATALYDYEAAEGNELTFPENAKITGVEFPDEDWWSGEYAGQQGLFPANYVQLDE